MVREGGFNPHALRHRNLNPGRLPFRHSRVRRLTIARIAAFRNRGGEGFSIYFPPSFWKIPRNGVLLRNV